MFKACTKCGRELECASNNFYKNKRGKFGFSSSCKECKRRDDRAYRIENAERAKSNGRMFFLNNPSYKKEYNEKNADKIRTYKSNYYLANKDRLKRLKRRYYLNNLDKLAAYRKMYYKNNVEKIRNYEKTDRQKRFKNIRYHRYEAKRRELPYNFSQAQWELCKSEFNHHCAYCGDRRRLTKDHFVPLSSGGEFTVNNIVPACGSCNSSKQDKDFFAWYPQQFFYSATREASILKYLNYDKATKLQQLSIL